jgi:hypothetical protein
MTRSGTVALSPSGPPGTNVLFGMLGHYELGIDARAHRRIETAFSELAHTI